MAILVLNPGSTTLKSAVVDEQGRVAFGETVETWDLGQAARAVLSSLSPTVTAIACRVVHGGQRFTEPVKVTAGVVQAVQELGELAPLHNFGAAAVLQACLDLHPTLPVVAVFDTAFHATLPSVARTYALPFAVVEREGIRRYGFHGIVHKATSHLVADLLKSSGRKANRIITCHLGGGASLCAVLSGKSIDTTMGFTPLEGLMMATRSGDIDPGIILYLLKKGWDGAAIEHLLNQESGLLGVSGESVDPRVLLAAAEQGNERAALAIELYTYRVAKAIAGMTVPLRGLDGISFSGGIGQNSAVIRQNICQHLGHLGVEISQEEMTLTDTTSPQQLHTSASAVGVWATPSSEEVSIANEALSVL